MSTRKKVRPLCLGASGSVRASRMPWLDHCAAEVHTFCPLIRQPPSVVRSARVRSDGQVRAGLGLGEQLAPQQIAAQRRQQIALLLLLGAVGDQRGHHPGGDAQVADPDPGGRQLLLDRRAAVRGRRPVRTARGGAARRSRWGPGRGGRRRGSRPRTPSMAVAGRGPVGPPPPAGSSRSQCAPGAVGGEPGGAQPVACRRCRAAAARHGRPPQMEMGVVLPGEADAAEDLDAVLGAAVRRRPGRSRRRAPRPVRATVGRLVAARGPRPRPGRGPARSGRACRRTGA